MIASIRVVELTEITPAAICTLRTPMPTPAIAVPTGIIDATSEPRVMTRTMIATPRPSASTTVMRGTWMEKISPPMSTVDPGRVVSRVLAASVSCSRWASVMVEEVPCTRIMARPLVPSSLIRPSMFSL